MIFEIGKQYIVEVSKDRIIPIEEFSRERYFDKDHDDLDFLTDEEKEDIINAVLEDIKSEIEQMDFDYGDYYDNTESIRKDVVEVIDNYKTKIEEGEYNGTDKI